ncbi:MAG: LamG-like jellyroll fold domain-containing protein [Candidatus Hodarchaeota archaeon]
MKRQYKSFVLYFIIITLGIFSCDFINPLFDENGSLAIKCIINKQQLEKTSDASSPLEIVRIRCIIYKGSSIKKDFDLVKKDNRFKGSKKIKKGTYEVKVEAYDESNVDPAYTGSASGIEVSPLKTTDVVIILEPTEVTLTISVNPSNSGSISKNPDKTQYKYGETIQLTASPASGYQFDHWDGDLSGSSNPVNIEMNGDKSVTAVFIDSVEKVTTPNTPTGPSIGSIGQSLSFNTGGSTSNLGHTVEYRFDWGDGTPLTWGDSTQSHVYNIVGTYQIQAQARCQTHTSVLSNWSQSMSISISGHTLNITINPTGSGSVTKNPNKTQYNHNEIVELTASPSPSYQFDHWEGDLSGSNNPADITMSMNKNVTAVFTPNIPGLVAYYPFNGNANDESGKGNHGTVNGAILANDRFGNSNKAFYFDGDGDNIDCGDRSTLKISGDITVCAWVNLQANSHGQVIVNKYNRTENKGWLLEIVSDGRAIFDGRPGYGGEETSQSGLSSQSVFDHNWCFLVGQRQGSDWKIFFNGILSSQRVGSNEDFSNSVNLFIGVQSDRPGDSAAFSKGSIDDIRIFNRALTDQEIQTLYHEGGW